jgi:hypothetical protein
MPRIYNRPINLKIDAGGIQIVKAPGSLFVIKESSAAFDVEFDDDGKSTFEGGYTIDTGEDKFQKITIYNRSSSSALAVEGFVGLGSGKPGVYYDYLRTRSTRIVPQSLNMNPGVVTIPGLLSAGDAATYGMNPNARRKHIVITNTHASEEIHLKKSGTAFGWVFPERERIIEGDDDITITNPSAGTILVLAEKHFYL